MASWLWCAKMAEWIEVLFAVKTFGGLRNVVAAYMGVLGPDFQNFLRRS